MVRSLIRCGAAAVVFGLGACKLEVSNPNNPGTAQVKATPADLENFLGAQYRRWHTAMYGSLSNVWGMANVQSFEDYSSLSNNCMGQRVGIPRASNDNSVGNGCATEQRRVYFTEAEVARSVSDVLRRMNETGFTFGSAAEDARNRAFAEFLRGLAMGYNALVYDSASVISPDDPLQASGAAEPGELSDYKHVMTAALDALQKSIDAATAATAAGGSNGFPLPSTWMFTPNSMTSAEFIKVVRSYRARLRANVARNPAERAAVDWDAVIADAQNGITADHYNTTNTITGPFNVWVNQFHTFTTWHQMTPFIIGMADSSGTYATWVASPLSSRGSGTLFFMQTADQRFPQGATRAAQLADFDINSLAPPNGTGCASAATPCKRYFDNRPSGNDNTSGSSWGWSNYDFVRFFSWRTSGDGGTGQNGKFPFFTKAELDMLQAEGLIRKGNYAAAAALINITRTSCGPTPTPGCTTRPAGNGTVGVGGGLPAITVFDGTTSVPGGNACVPKVPVNATSAGGGTLTCGNMFEAMKWEKRIETAYTHFAAWFLDSRGWGDLPAGTGLHWAPPYEDLQARYRTGTQIYSTGGPTGNAVAPTSSYGW
jgi:hypothetical protein